MIALKEGCGHPQQALVCLLIESTLVNLVPPEEMIIIIVNHLRGEDQAPPHKLPIWTL